MLRACVVVFGVIPMIAGLPVVQVSLAQERAPAKEVGVLSPEQAEWLNASLEERIQIAEKIGEKGAANYAKKQGWTSLLGEGEKTILQGPDQIYRDPSGKIYVVEAKGGTSPLGRGYGYPQGTSEWAVKSAEYVLKNPKATAAERKAALEELKAAAEKRLVVYVIRTPHVLGKPGEAVVESIVECSDEAAEMAVKILKWFGVSIEQSIQKSSEKSRGGTAKGDSTVEKGAGKGAKSGKTGVGSGKMSASAAAKSESANMSVDKVSIPKIPKKLIGRVGKIAATAGAVADVGITLTRIFETEKRFQNGEVTEQERELKHVQEAARLVGGWGGAWPGAWIGGQTGGFAGSCVAPGPGTAIGSGVGVLTGGVVGYLMGEEAARSVATSAVKAVHSTGTTITEACSTGWEKVKGSAQWVGNKVSQTWRWMWGYEEEE